MLIIALLVSLQIDVNEIVGSEIDALEASKYHLFSDIEGFMSARFFESDDSIIIRLEYLRNETTSDSSVAIDHELLKSLSSYIRHFRMIIEDGYSRKSFVEKFKIDWPIVTKREIDQIVESSRGARIKSMACCVTGGCALGAYSAALLTRKISTEIDTINLPTPCIIGGDIGCVFIPVPIEREVYRFSETAYLTGAGVGSALSYIWARSKYRRHDVLCRAIGHDIIAFDHENYPITGKDLAAANRGTNEVLFGTLGLGAGLLGAGVTAVGLLTPWADKYPEQQWQARAIDAAVIIICGVEFLVVTNFLLNKGREMDRQATIERLMHRHN